MIWKNFFKLKALHLPKREKLQFFKFLLISKIKSQKKEQIQNFLSSLFPTIWAPLAAGRDSGGCRGTEPTTVYKSG